MSLLKKDIVNFVDSSRLFDEYLHHFVTDAIYAFVCNVNGSNRRALFEVIEKTDWIDNTCVYKNLKRQISSLKIGPDYYFLDLKSELSSSSTAYVSKFAQEGFFDKEKIISIDKNEKPTKKPPDDAVLVVIEDFIGTADFVLSKLQLFPNYKVIILCFAMAKSGNTALLQKPNITVMRSGLLFLETFEEKGLSKHAINLLNKVCNSCAQEDFKFGWKNSKLLVTYEGVCPNNTISMLWHHSFKGKYVNWIPIFSREHNIIANARLRQLFVHDKIILALARQSSLRKFSDTEILTLVCIRLFVDESNEIMNLIGINSIEHLASVLKELLRKKALVKNNVGEVFLSREYINQISNIIKKTLKDFLELRKSV